MRGSGKQSSFFANPIGFSLWIGLSAVLYYNHLAYPAVFCLIFGLLFFFSWLWSRYALFKLEITVQSGVQCAFPGGSLSLSCRASNKKLLPLIWLELSFPLPDEGCVSPAFEEHKKNLFAEEDGREIPSVCGCIGWLLSYQEASMEIPIKAVKRGICTLPQALAASGDLLGLGIRESVFSFPSSSSLVVYPALLPIQVHSLIESTSDMEAGKHGYMEDVTLLKMSRPYQPGDSAKKINWRQLAAQDRMNINIYETVFPRLATFLIDLSSFRKKSTEYNSLTASETSVWQPMTDELEDMLSLTASAILELEKRGICCGLIVPGKSSEDCCFQYPGKHGSSPDELLYSLAAIHYHQEDIKIPFWEIGSHFSMIGTLYIVVSSYSSITIEANGLSGLGHFAVLARNASDCDNTCPDKCFLFSDLLKADENSL